MIDVSKYISDPAEMRLGNLVFHHKRGLTEWRSDDFKAFSHPMMNGNYGYHPIPLTEKVLEACGFYPQYGRMVLDIPRFEREHKQLRYGNDYLFLAEGEEEKPRHQDGIVTLWNEDVQGALSLHMFQNFYYLLTGSELQIDLEKLKEAVK